MSYRHFVTVIFGTAMLTLMGPTSAAFSQGGTDGPAHAMAMHGQPKYGPEYKHFDYVNPNASKGGTIVLGAIGSYDTLNSFIVKGTAAVGLGRMYQALTVGTSDEAFTQYCLICETMEVPDDRSWVEYTLRPEARWHDGQPITVDDVLYSLKTLREKGVPFYKSYYRDVTKAEKTGPRSVKFTFGGGVNLELPLIMGQLTIIPKHYWEEREARGEGYREYLRDFTVSTLDPPLGSGAYRIKELDPGRSITYERVQDHWSANLPAGLGSNNYDVLRYEYYRDATVALEAFKGGDLDFRAENVSKNWATAYDTAAVTEGLIKKEEIPHQRTAGMQAWVFNTRRAIFSDPQVRRALAYAFNYEWTNENLFYSAYTRTDSFFDNSELGSRGLLTDAGAEEREILERYRDRLPPELFTEVYTPPTSDPARADDRNNLLTANDMLTEAGWIVRDGKRVNAESGEPMNFEILLISPSFERIALPYSKNMEQLGIDVAVRTVDTSQYVNRLDEYDFDVVVSSWGQSLSPGNEQRAYWGSVAADRSGGRNLMGIKDPVIDELIELVISAVDRDSLVQRTRALDRALLWGHYLVPNWHVPHDRLAYWDKFERPEVTPTSGAQFFAWWINTEDEATLVDRKRQVAQLEPAEQKQVEEGQAVVQSQVVVEELPAAEEDIQSGTSRWLIVVVIGTLAVIAVLTMVGRRRKST